MLVLLVCHVAVLKVTECDPWLRSHYWDSSHCPITSHGGDLKCYHMWQKCLAVLCDVWRNTGRGSGRCGVQHMSVHLLVTNVAGRNQSPLKPPPSLPVICFQLPSCQDALQLYHISLSIRVLLFMLLVVAGDVERNPGPPKREG